LPGRGNADPAHFMRDRGPGRLDPPVPGSSNRCGSRCASSPDSALDSAMLYSANWRDFSISCGPFPDEHCLHTQTSAEIHTQNIMPIDNHDPSCTTWSQPQLYSSPRNSLQFKVSLMQSSSSQLSHSLLTAGFTSHGSTFGKAAHRSRDWTLFLAGLLGTRRPRRIHLRRL